MFYTQPSNYHAPRRKGKRSYNVETDSKSVLNATAYKEDTVGSCVTYLMTQMPNLFMEVPSAEHAAQCERRTYTRFSSCCVPFFRDGKCVKSLRFPVCVRIVRLSS